MLIPNVVILYGAPKEGKTSAALTWPTNIADFDFDQGVLRGRGAQELLEKNLLNHIKLPWPASVVGLGGSTDTASPKPKGLTDQEWLKQKLMARAKEPLKGWLELWDTFVERFVSSLEDPATRTLILDTGTFSWIACHRSLLQYVQLTSDKARERLTQIEYGEANDRMTTVLNTPRSYNKNLVIVCHTKPVWGKRLNSRGDIEEYDTGEITIDGYKYTLAAADVAILCKKEEDRFYGEVTHTGITGLPVGTTLEPVSYANIITAIETNEKLQKLAERK